MLADLAFRAAAKQHTVRHYDADTAGLRLRRRDHVLHPSEITVVLWGHAADAAAMRVGGPLLRAPSFETEWRIGDNNVELFEFAAAGDEARVAQRVVTFDFGILNIVDQQVHPADRSGSLVDFLAVEAHLSDAAAALLHLRRCFD